MKSKSEYKRKPSATKEGEGGGRVSHGITAQHSRFPTLPLVVVVVVVVVGKRQEAGGSRQQAGGGWVS